jgi:hypothetical protein
VAYRTSKGDHIVVFFCKARRRAVENRAIANLLVRFEGQIDYKRYLQHHMSMDNADEDTPMHMAPYMGHKVRNSSFGTFGESRTGGTARDTFSNNDAPGRRYQHNYGRNAGPYCRGDLGVKIE